MAVRVNHVLDAAVRSAASPSPTGHRFFARDVSEHRAVLLPRKLLEYVDEQIGDRLCDGSFRILVW